jgi:hypothetical protein
LKDGDIAVTWLPGRALLFIQPPRPHDLVVIMEAYREDESLGPSGSVM